MKNKIFKHIKNNLSPFTSHLSPSEGFTLIELIIYMGVLAILIAMLGSAFAQIVEVQTDTKATSAVDQDSRYIIAKLNYDMQASSSISAPAVGSQSATLQMVVNSVQQTYTLDGGGNFQLTAGSQSANLNSVNTGISNVSFKRLGTGTATDTIQVKFTLTSKVARSGNKTEVKTFQTTIGKQ